MRCAKRSTIEKAPDDFSLWKITPPLGSDIGYDSEVAIETSGDLRLVGTTSGHLRSGNFVATLNAKLRGHYQYYGRPTNYRSIRKFYQEVCHIWKKWLSRRTRGDGLTWETFKAILRRHPLMRPRILHSWQGAASYA